MTDGQALRDDRAAAGAVPDEQSRSSSSRSAPSSTARRFRTPRQTRRAIAFLYELFFQRLPNEDEMRVGQEFVAKFQSSGPEPAAPARRAAGGAGRRPTRPGPGRARPGAQRRTRGRAAGAAAAAHRLAGVRARAAAHQRGGLCELTLERSSRVCLYGTLRVARTAGREYRKRDAPAPGAGGYRWRRRGWQNHPCQRTRRSAPTPWRARDPRLHRRLP